MALVCLQCLSVSSIVLRIHRRSLLQILGHFIKGPPARRVQLLEMRRLHMATCRRTMQHNGQAYLIEIHRKLRRCLVSSFLVNACQMSQLRLIPHRSFQTLALFIGNHSRGQTPRLLFIQHTQASDRHRLQPQLRHRLSHAAYLSNRWPISPWRRHRRQHHRRGASLRTCSLIPSRNW